MAAAKNIIVVKKAGLMIHHDYLKKAVSDATYLGTAVAHEGKLVIDHQMSRPTVQGVMAIQEALKDKTVVFCFGENKTILPEDAQPFDICVDKDKDIHVAVFMEGKFEGYSVPKSSHTDEWHCVEDYLSKYLPKLYRGAGNLTGLWSELQDEITRQTIANAWTDRGFIVMLSTEGEAIVVHNKGHVFQRDYTGFHTSTSLSWTEPKEPEAKVEEAKPLTLLQKIKLQKAGTPVPDGVKEVKTATSIPALATMLEDYEDVKLPEEAKDWVNKAKSTWWFEEVGYQPQNYKDLRTIVKRKKGTKQGIAAPLAATNVKDAATEGTADRVPFPKGSVDPKTLPDKIVATAPENFKDTSPKHVSMENLPILSPKQKLALRKEFFSDAEVIRTLGDDLKTLAFDPKKLKEFEDTYQTFYDGLGRTSDDTWFSFEALMKLVAVDPKAAAIYAFNRQNDHAQVRAQLKAILANPNNKIAAKVAM